MWEILFRSKCKDLRTKFNELKKYVADKISCSKRYLHYYTKTINNFKTQFVSKWLACIRHKDRFLTTEK